MNIGIVSPYYYPWYGGITEHVHHQYRELGRRGHAVKLITPFDGAGRLRAPGDLIRVGYPVPVWSNGTLTKIPLVPGWRRFTRAILDRERFDVLHLHQPLFCPLGQAFLFELRRRRRAGLPRPRVVGTFHACGGRLEELLLGLTGPWFRQFADAFDRRVAVSESAAAFVRGVVDGEFSIIPNGVDVDRFAAGGPAIERLRDGTPVILFVGRLEPRKGIQALLDSLPHLARRTRRPFRVVIVGEGLLAAWYRRRVPAALRDRVVFEGAVSFEDAPRYFRSADIFCSPAAYGESFGIVLVEAMAAGLPVVAGDNPGYRRVVSHRVDGLLVDPHSPQAIAGALAELVDRPELRRSLGDAAARHCQVYRWERLVDALEEAYGAAPGAGRGPGASGAVSASVRAATPRDAGR